MTTNDGRGGTYSTRFDYYDGRFYPGTMPDRRYLGFGSITQTDEQWNGSNWVTVRSLRTAYNQNPGYEGKVASIARYASTGQCIDLKSYAYELVFPNPGTELARVTLEASHACEFGGLGQTLTAATTYDAYGNPATKSLGGSDVPTIVTTTTFANDPVNWILGRVTDVSVAVGTTTLRHSSNTWTPDLHTLTAQSAWSDTAGAWLTTSFAYDANGNVSGVTQPPTGDGLDRTTSTVYDSTYRAYPATITDALQHDTQIVYEYDGQPTSVSGPNRPNGDVWSFTYDVFRRKATETRPDGGTTTYSYQGYGNATSQYLQVTRSVDQNRSLIGSDWFDGFGFVYRHEETGSCSDGVVAVQRAKDAAGRLSQESKPYCHGNTPVFTSYAYDSSGRLQTVTTPDSKLTTYAYGNGMRSRTDVNGNTTVQSFNARQQITGVGDAAGQAVTYDYDPLGNLTTVSSPSPPSAGSTSIAYDSLGRRTSMSAPELGTTQFTYDAAGNMTAKSSNGNSVIFEYDALNRVIAKHPWGEVPVTFTYDEAQFTNAVGRLTTASDAAGVVNYSYSPNGLVAASKRQTDGSSFTTSFTYDQVGRVTHLVYPDSSYADYVWSGAKLSSVSLNGSLVAQWQSYDPSGRPLNVVYGNGVTTALGYDPYSMGHLTSVRTASGATELQNLSLDWYSGPNTGGVNLGAISDNRSNKIVNGTNTDASAAFGYDCLNRLTYASGMALAGAMTRSLNYTGTQVTSGTGLSNVTYDGSGNMISKTLDGVDWRYQWTVDNNLAMVAINGAKVAAMTYDFNGQRVKKEFTPASGPTVTTLYIGDLYERRTYGDGSPQRHTVNVYANGQLITSVTRSGSIVTALNADNAWRIESAAVIAPTPKYQCMSSDSTVGVVRLHFRASVSRRAVM